MEARRFRKAWAWPLEPPGVLAQELSWVRGRAWEVPAQKLFFVEGEGPAARGEVFPPVPEGLERETREECSFFPPVWHRLDQEEVADTWGLWIVGFAEGRRLSPAGAAAANRPDNLECPAIAWLRTRNYTAGKDDGGYKR